MVGVILLWHRGALPRRVFGTTNGPEGRGGLDLIRT
jgi:hypothetical protein